MTRLVALFAAHLLVIAASQTRAEAGDPGRGETIFQYCYACHSVQPDERNLEGPNLRGIVGRRIAAEEGYSYSTAMRAFARREQRWSDALLQRYLAAPSELVPKTSMAFHGVGDEDERADLIAYLRSTGVTP